jgi:hypothetical protein
LAHQKLHQYWKRKRPLGQQVQAPGRDRVPKLVDERRRSL